MLLFGYCLIPVVWFSDSRRLVTESSVLGFRNLFGFQVTRNRSRAALVVCKVYSCFAPAFSEGMTLCRPPRSSVSWIFDAGHVDIPGQNPETVWVTGAHPVNWQRPGSWEAQEIGGQLLKMGEGWYFLIRSSVAALAFWLRGYHTGSKAWRFLS